MVVDYLDYKMAFWRERYISINDENYDIEARQRRVLINPNCNHFSIKYGYFECNFQRDY